eukprot:CAMPEP_0196668476 /NCGR_PEP_ID=MMETSP1086-20130531/65640_1 /TAXON_ID=77921 /ORGANISM="Cyanoptyche  gloeocystis , Strain SAG4.97" /LENGTH=81 /DNA_ID=CAMNT_0042005885 /DNA_START=1442 /DNA_END=1687 /DNA_ORIENTATION=-
MSEFLPSDLGIMPEPSSVIIRQVAGRRTSRTFQGPASTVSDEGLPHDETSGREEIVCEVPTPEYSSSTRSESAMKHFGTRT